MPKDAKERSVGGGGGIVGYFDLINTFKLGKEVLSDTWHSFPKWGDGKLRKKKDIAKPQNLIRSGGDA